MRNYKRPIVLVTVMAMALAACTADGGEAVTTVPDQDTTAALDPGETTTTTGPTGEDALVGVLEGPRVVTDAAQFPSTFSEAPMLAAMVAAGELPEVTERVPSDPLVIEPLNEIGTYGGDWRRGFAGPGDTFNGFRCCAHDQFLSFSYDGSEIVPNIAKDWEESDGGRTFTVSLREGMKWSDGEPFTADDIMFWYEDIYLNEVLVPNPSPLLAVGGEQGTIEKIDDHTIRFSFSSPYPMFPQILAGQSAIGGGQSQHGRNFMGLFAPQHYLSQFLPAYVGQDEADALAAAAGFDDWILHLRFLNNWAENVDLPVVAAWKTVSPPTESQWILERNPYSIWVDTAGNQLPYIDRVVMSLFQDLEVANLQAIAGNYDYQSRHMALDKLGVFLENRDRGGYNIHLDPAPNGCDVCLFVNQTYSADPEVARWLQTTDFRIALSLGIDRDQLNEVFWLGLGTPGSPVVDEASPENPGPEFRTLNSIYDPDLANEMLDSLGLSEKDSEGFRLRTDNGSRLRIEVLATVGQFMPHEDIAEMIAEQWRDIGIQMDLTALERSAGAERVNANDIPISMWANDGTELLWESHHVLPRVVQPQGGTNVGPLWGLWWATNGADGVEPTPEMLVLYEAFARAPGLPEVERIELAQQVWRTSVEQQWVIGTVGVSPAFGGVRVVNRQLGNVPARQWNTPHGKAPSAARPMTFYWVGE